MEAWILEMIEKFGYFGVFFLIAIENIFPPIPSEVILTFGGFMTTKTSMHPVGVIIAATLGAVVGAIVLYKLGGLLGRERIDAIVAKYGHILGLKPVDIDKTYTWFEKYDKKTVFFCRMIPLIRSLISIPAGMAKMNFSVFLMLTTIGTAIWNVILVLAGVFLGESWDTILSYFDLYSHITYAVIAAVGIGVIVWLILRRKKSIKMSDYISEKKGKRN